MDWTQYQQKEKVMKSLKLFAAPNLKYFYFTNGKNNISVSKIFDAYDL